MKKPAMLFLCISLISQLFAQTTAEDFIKTDCNGVPHHLFDELNAGQVVILEYIMLNCTPCATAGKGLRKILAPYEKSHPGKVKIYVVGFDDSYTCQQMSEWKSSNKLEAHTVFTGGSADVNYYGGMGMPTILVVGGSNHKVFYKKQGYTSAENLNIQDAIGNALFVSGALPLSSDTTATLHANPADQKLHIRLDKQITLIEISDLAGKSIFNKNIRGLEATSIDVSSWINGTYLVTFISNDNVIFTRKLLVQH